MKRLSTSTLRFLEVAFGLLIVLLLWRKIDGGAEESLVSRPREQHSQPAMVAWKMEAWSGVRTHACVRVHKGAWLVGLK